MPTISRRVPERGCRAFAWLLLGHLIGAPLPAAESPWAGFDTTGFRLERDAGGYRLARPQGEPVPVPTEWLEPPGVRESESESVVSSLRFVPEVTAFAIGGGRLGLHLASYDIQETGSLQAASGSDVLLILDPAAGTLIPGGLQLGISRGRARSEGCFGARFHHLSVGDVDCDRYLDVAVVREEVECRWVDDEGPPRRVYTRGPMRWYRQQADGWVEDPPLEGHLPCAGLVELPLLALGRTPVDFVLGFRRGEDPLPPGDPKPFELAAAGPAGGESPAASAAGGFRAEFLYRLDEHAARNFLALAGAIPEEEYGWRPAEGVRSVAEVLRHIAGSNYWFSERLGAETPEEPRARLRAAEGKAETVAALEESFDYLRKTVLGLRDQELEAPLELFGRATSRREAVMVSLTHISEHLGQLIAYARAVGVVPPWSR